MEFNEAINSDSSIDEVRWFWQIIDQVTLQPDALYSILMGFNKEDIKKFKVEFDVLKSPLMWEIIPEVCTTYMSEDGLEDLSDWIVSQGSAYYYSILADHALCPTTGDQIILDKLLYYVAFNVYYERFEEDLSDYDD
jgi:hypothetical protein